MRYELSDVVRKLRGTAHHAPDRFEAMLTGKIDARDVQEISSRLRALSRPMSIDAVAFALVSGMGLNPVVLAHAASLLGFVDVRDENGSSVVGMTRRGGAEVVIGHGPVVTWGAGGDDPAGLYRHPGLVPDSGALMVDRLPDAVVALLPGRATSSVVAHPVLDALGLRIDRAVSRDDLTLVQPQALAPLGTEALIRNLTNGTCAGGRTRHRAHAVLERTSHGRERDEMSFFDKLKDLAQTTQKAMGDEFSKLRNADALDALVGASVMIAAADGKISGDEKTKLLGFLKNTALTKAYSTDKVIKVFTEHADRFSFDVDVGRAEALRIIGKQRSNVETARAIARLCVLIGKADGEFDQAERSAATQIVNELGLNPSEFV